MTDYRDDDEIGLERYGTVIVVALVLLLFFVLLGGRLPHVLDPIAGTLPRFGLA